MAGNDFFQRMCKEAQDELASGEKSWKDVESNTLILACFGMLSNHLASKIVKPLWWFTGAVGVGVIGYLISAFLGR